MSVAFHVVEVVTMWDRRIIGVPNRPGKKTIEIEIPDGGESWTAASVAPDGRLMSAIPPSPTSQ
jgi:hypothetical protein